MSPLDASQFPPLDGPAKPGTSIPYGANIENYGATEMFYYLEVTSSPGTSIQPSHDTNLTFTCEAILNGIRCYPNNNLGSARGHLFIFSINVNGELTPEICS